MGLYECSYIIVDVYVPVLPLLHGILHAILFTVYIVSRDIYIQRTNINNTVVLQDYSFGWDGLDTPSYLISFESVRLTDVDKLPC